MEETDRSDASLHLMDSDDLILMCFELSSWKLNPLSPSPCKEEDRRVSRDNDHPQQGDS